MKLILAISALAALVVAQADINSLNDCGKKCVSDMTVQKASDPLKCSNDDAKCLCGKSDFMNGLKDCSSQACGADQSAKVLAYAQGYCSGATATGGSSSSTSAVAASASSISASASSALSSAASSASNALSSVSSSIASAASSASGAASSGASSAASSAASSSSSAGFAMKTQAPLAAAGVLGLAALLI